MFAKRRRLNTMVAPAKIKKFEIFVTKCFRYNLRNKGLVGDSVSHSSIMLTRDKIRPKILISCILAPHTVGVADFF